MGTCCPAHTVLFVATPSHDGKVVRQYLQGCLQLQTRFAGRIRFDLKVGSFLPRNRDVLTSRFLASGASHMLCIDSDIGFTAADVEMLIAAGEDFVSGCYARKTPKADVPAKLLVDEKGPLVACDFVPGGFLLLSRRCVESMTAHYADLAYGASGTITHALWSPNYRLGDGEDVAFCRRWRAMGERVWLHRGVVLEHVGDKVYVPAPIPRRTVATQEEAARTIARHTLLHDPAAEMPVILEEFARAGGKRFLEIGTWRGATTAAVAVAFPKAEITTVELPNTAESPWNPQDETMVGVAYRTLGLADRVEQLRMSSRDMNAGTYWKPEHFDLVFVDGDHSEAGCASDLVVASKLIRDGGTILVHDYTDEGDAMRPQFTRDVAKAVDAFAEQGCWVKTRLPGWLVRLTRANAVAAGETSAA